MCIDRDMYKHGHLVPAAHHDVVHLGRAVFRLGKAIATLDFKPHALIRPCCIRLFTKGHQFKQ